MIIYSAQMPDVISDVIHRLDREQMLDFIFNLNHSSNRTYNEGLKDNWLLATFLNASVAYLNEQANAFVDEKISRFNKPKGYVCIVHGPLAEGWKRGTVEATSSPTLKSLINEAIEYAANKYTDIIIRPFPDIQKRYSKTIF